MSKKEIEMLPFHAINEFMRDDYRLTILQEVFTNLEGCVPTLRVKMLSLFSSGVKLPGFRNSSQAPLPIRVKNSVALFEKSAAFVGLVLECWSHQHSTLKEAIFEVLTQKGWKIHPLQVDRSQLPGFGIQWPKSDTFEVIKEAVHGLRPELEESDDNISLMAVWVGNRLPYDLFSGDEGEIENGENSG